MSWKGFWTISSSHLLHPTRYLVPMLLRGNPYRYRLTIPDSMALLTELSDSAAPFLRPRMRTVINLGQMLKIKMSIDLGGADIGMSQQLLHRAQITR